MCKLTLKTNNAPVENGPDFFGGCAYVTLLKATQQESKSVAIQWDFCFFFIRLETRIHFFFVVVGLSLSLSLIVIIRNSFSSFPSPLPYICRSPPSDQSAPPLPPLFSFLSLSSSDTNIQTDRQNHKT